MNLHRVSLFTQVVKDGGFTAAARTLGLPKSALSAAVSRLEGELGVRLLHRSTRRIALTEEGAAFFARVAPALEALDEAALAATDMQTALSGTIRVTASAETGTRLLEPTISRFLREHPDVSVEVVLTMRYVDLIAEGFDLALRAGPVRDRDLTAQKLGDVEAGLFAAPPYLAAHGAPRTVAELAQHHCVVLGTRDAHAAWVFVGPDGEEPVSVTARLTSDHYPFVLRAITSGVGIGVLPLFLCEAEVAAGALQRVLPEFAVPGTSVSLVHVSSRHLPAPRKHAD